MGKIVKDSHKVGESGVLLFNQYCNSHKPFIIFREVTKHDFGIDGEVELTMKNEDGKTEATGEILKVQIKSVNSDNSYIRNEKASKFDFYAEKEDIEYWQKHKKFGYKVLLVLADLRINQLYVKEVDDVDLQKATRKGSSLPLEFDKEIHKLIFDKNDFVVTYSKIFRSRVNYSSSETLSTNALKCLSFPKTMYLYSTKFSTKKKLFEKIPNSVSPHFVLKGNEIFTFKEISQKECPEFYRDALLDKEAKKLNLGSILDEQAYLSIYFELVYEHLKFDLYPKLLSFSRDYRRFYFRLKDSEDLLTVGSRTRKRNDENQKKVVTHHVYGKDSFFKHRAVELKLKIYDNKMSLIVNPKYLFTSDRKTPLEPKKITKYTNYLTAREFNNEYANQLHFWKNYLFKGAEEWKLYVSDEVSLIFGDYLQFEVPFSVAGDTKSKVSKETSEETIQTSLF